MTKIVYNITIVEVSRGTVHNMRTDETEIDKKVERHLGGWDNLKGSSSSNCSIPLNNSQYSGMTKDGKLMFSILKHEQKED